MDGIKNRVASMVFGPDQGFSGGKGNRELIYSRTEEEIGILQTFR